MALLVTAVMILGWSSSRPTRWFADGSRLTLERVSFGTDEGFFAYRAWKNKVPAGQPKVLRRLIGPNGQSTRSIKNKPELVCWLSSSDQAGGLPAFGARGYAVQIVDEHGCAFWSTAGRSDGDFELGAWVDGFRFGSFPRRAQRFKMRIRKEPGFVAELVVTNPARMEASNWEPEPLPAIREQGGMRYELKRVWATDGLRRLSGFPPEGRDSRIDAEVAVSRDDVALSGWRVVAVESEDATGNPGPDLCEHEAAWKIKTEMARPARDEFAEGEVWRLGKFLAPTNGQWTALNLSNQLSSVPVIIQGLGGAGHYIYSNDVCVAVERLPQQRLGDGPRPMSLDTDSYVCVLGSPDRYRSVTRSGAHLVISFPAGGGEHHVVTLRGRDGQGRSLLHESRLPSISPVKAGLEVSPDAKEMDLELIIHRTEQVTFFVKPPRKE